MTISTLPLFHTVAGQPVIVLGTGDAAEAKRRLVQRAGGIVVDHADAGIARGARLAFVAHDEQEACAKDAADLRSAGLLVNVTDRPELCDFVVPSILDRAPVLVAVSTGGASAGLAKALRLRLETLLPQRLGDLAKSLAAARMPLRARFPDAAQRRRALDAALAEGGALDPLCEHDASAVAVWLEVSNRAQGGNMVEIQLRSADPDDLTLREARLLGSADTIFHAPDLPPAVLARARADAARIVLAQDESVQPRPGLTVILCGFARDIENLNRPLVVRRD